MATSFASTISRFGIVLPRLLLARADLSGMISGLSLNRPTTFLSLQHSKNSARRRQRIWTCYLCANEFIHWVDTPKEFKYILVFHQFSLFYSTTRFMAHERLQLYPRPRFGIIVSNWERSLLKTSNLYYQFQDPGIIPLLGIGCLNGLPKFFCNIKLFNTFRNSFSIELRIQFMINIVSDTQSKYLGSSLFSSLILPSIYPCLFDSPVAILAD